MYHVISTGFTAILLYLISYSFYRIGYYSIQYHRRFWNILLAAAFIITALAGIFLALQINYKWNIPFIKTVLKWHVEFGIGMAITGFFHFIWHLNYYLKLFSKSGKHTYISGSQKFSSSAIRNNLFIVGFISSSIQLLLMREIMNVTGGYELITGSFLGSWLIGSAIGASIAGKSELNDIKKINLYFTISPVISLILMLFLSRLYLNPGETPSFLAAIIYTFLVLIPFCLVSGFTFIKLIAVAGSENKFAPGKSFSIETAGGILAGIFIAVLSAGVLSTYKLLMLIILLSICYTLIFWYFKNMKLKISCILVIFILGAAVILLNPDLLFRQILLPAIKVTGTKDTPYGNLTKGEYKGEESLYYNQRLLTYNDDATEREEDIHYAMLQSDSPKKVIMISGSPQSHIPEILKYPVSSIIYIERDPELVKFEKSAVDKFQGKAIIVNRDAYRYISNSNEQADVIIMLVPPPSTLLLNRYYTTEFFKDVKKKLKPDGIFMCSPGPGDDYFNKESLNLYSSVFNSLAAIFSNVKPVVGNKLYFIASEKAISLSFCQMADKKHIKNIYVSSDFLEDDLIARKSDEVMALIDRSVAQNRAALPIACFHAQQYQFSKNLGEKVPAIVLMILVFAVPVVMVKRRNLVMYFSASALAGFEIVILLSLQIMVGNMYQLTGLIIAGLMTGLAIGSGINFSFLNNISLRSKVIFLVIFYLIFGMTYNFMLELKGGFLQVMIIIISGFLPAFITGLVFNELTLKINSKGLSSSPAVYSADLAGSAFGFIFISGIIIPAFGIRISIFLLSALVFIGILIMTISKAGLKSK
jgi:spermidine synthase